MIDVNHLSKKYAGGITAVQDVSFEVASGDVVGLLGPNGAGKSTIMRILSGYISPTGGEVTINGIDVTQEGIEVRKQIGYLPENCPLYPEMRVCEYLGYRADIKRVPGRHRKRRMDQVLEQCNLTDVRRRLIGNLSKGFRQRVGIADALIHSPDLLILDEPTIGLDPHQIVQIRGLIQQLAEEHTILISSHILSEVESTCNQVIVLCEGRIRDYGTLEEMGTRWLPLGEFRVEVQADAGEFREVLKEMGGIQNIRLSAAEGWLCVEFSCKTEVDPREALCTMIHEKGWPLREVHRKEHHLEEAFLKMTSPPGVKGKGATA
jgi:ABC-2 type transport system ATP-binding protein